MTPHEKNDDDEDGQDLFHKFRYSFTVLKRVLRRMDSNVPRSPRVKRQTHSTIKVLHTKKHIRLPFQYFSQTKMEIQKCTDHK